MLVMLIEFQGRSILRKGIQIYAEEIYQEFPVDVMQLVIIFAMVFCQIFFINFTEVMKVERTFWVYAFMDNKVFPVFYMSQRVAAVGTFQRVSLRKAVVIWREGSRADFTEDLSFSPIILVKIRLWGIAAWACTTVRNVAFRAAVDRFYLFSVLPFEIRDVIFVIPFFVVDDFRKFVNLEFLVLGRMGLLFTVDLLTR